MQRAIAKTRLPKNGEIGDVGKHYVPQKYLRGFEALTKPGWIWMYDKLLGTKKCLPIKHVAQEADFYSPEVEEKLTEGVEKPANVVIEKLRNGAVLDDVDRAHLAYYVTTMLRRVPNARNKAYDKVPALLADSVQKSKAHYEAEAREGRIDSKTLAERLAEIDAAEKKFQKQPPPEIVDIIENPLPFQSHLYAVFSMTWRFLSTGGPSFFLTSDNPAYFFECDGLADEKVELIFPISRILALHCSWQPDDKSGIIAANPKTQKLVKEFNRRVASGATRFVFYHEEKDWILDAAKKTIQQLNRIQWS